MPQKILVIDDHPDTAESLAELLRMMGHEVHAAVNAFTAFSLASVFKAEVVFIDLVLGEEDGCELAQRMRSQLGMRKARFYAMMGHPEEQTRERAMQAGCNAYFLKPLDPRIFEELLGA